MSTVDGADELQRDWFRQVSQGYAKIALRRAAEPAELTGLAAWLASADNSYVTGQSIAADGGLSVTF
jgi:NAD(P)-dependent dehydrogenase (short-subunit alcohol dehydrogenase family)